MQLAKPNRCAAVHWAIACAELFWLPFFLITLGMALRFLHIHSTREIEEKIAYGAFALLSPAVILHYFVSKLLDLYDADFFFLVLVVLQFPFIWGTGRMLMCWKKGLQWAWLVFIFGASLTFWLLRSEISQVWNW